jgi:hypothetical protein
VVECQERKSAQANEKDFATGIKCRDWGISDKIGQILRGEI